MSHDHSRNRSVKNLKLAFFLNFFFTILEIVGGIYTNSIAIISDAIHDFGDSLSLGTAWYLQVKSGEKADDKYSFGYRRFSLLGALINSVVLLGGSIYVIYAAVGRFIHPESSDPNGMLLFAIIGVIVNGYAAWKLSKGGTMNEKVVSWHLIEDVLGWVAILIVAIVLQFKNIEYLDPALSLLITLYILWNSFKRLRETLFIFLQGQPKNIDKSEITSRINAITGIDSLHHTRIWSLDGEHHVFTTHVKLNTNEANKIIALKKRIKKILDEYSFEFYTVETELLGEDCNMLRKE